MRLYRSKPDTNTESCPSDRATTNKEWDVRPTQNKLYCVPQANYKKIEFYKKSVTRWNLLHITLLIKNPFDIRAPAWFFSYSQIWNCKLTAHEFAMGEMYICIWTCNVVTFCRTNAQTLGADTFRYLSPLWWKNTWWSLSTEREWEGPNQFNNENVLFWAHY